MLKINEVLESQQYKFSKTMKNIPHSYTLKENWEDEELFFNIVNEINNSGKIEYFMGKPYIYYYTSTHKYWTMSNDRNITKLINRVEL